MFGQEERFIIKIINGACKRLVPKGVRSRSKYWSVGPGINSKRFRVAAKTEYGRCHACCFGGIVGRILRPVLRGEKNHR